MSSPTSLHVALLGLGQMGAPMARNLVACGFALRVWNRNPAQAAGVPGAQACASVAEAVAQADVVISMLADDTALREVSFGAGGVLAALPQGALHVGMSTVSLALVRELAARRR